MKTKVTQQWEHVCFFTPFGSQGAGTDDAVLIEILASRTGEQIKDVSKVYKKGDLQIL